jgi:hypothetical protein
MELYNFIIGKREERRGELPKNQFLVAKKNIAATVKHRVGQQ